MVFWLQSIVRDPSTKFGPYVSPFIKCNRHKNAFLTVCLYIV